MSVLAQDLRYIVLEKKRGQTPLQAVNAWKETHPGFANVPLSYAGRLDPMAEGKLLVLIGDECKKQDSYTKLDKEYEIEILLDLSTDSGDVLGMPRLVRAQEQSPAKSEVLAALAKEVGLYSRQYPIFSSKTVNGKPLFLYALEGTLDTIQIPEHLERIYGISLLNSREINSSALAVHVQELLSVVPRSDEPSKVLGADFRQDAVRDAWTRLFGELPFRQFTIFALRVTCGSGAYMRTLAERIGTSLGTGALALSIKRTKIGKYQMLGPVGFWTKTYR